MANVNDFKKNFDPNDYLRRFKAGGYNVKDFALQKMIGIFELLAAKEDGLSLLEIGCGPVIANLISAAGVVSEIVLAEYTQRNRQAIQQWLDRDPSAFDWSPYFKYVVQTLEGKDEQEVIKREQRLCSIIKAVVPCDISQDDPIEKGYEGPYDIVSSILCIESTCQNMDDFVACLHKIACLLKSEGILLLYFAERKNGDQESLGWYTVGTQRFYDVRLTPESVSSSLEKCGFHIVSMDRLPVSSYSFDGDCTGFVFIHANKK